jgi:hypothetical protein
MSEEGTSVIGTLISRFRSGPPVSKEHRQVISKDRLWWLNGECDGRKEITETCSSALLTLEERTNKILEKLESANQGELGPDILLDVKNFDQLLLDVDGDEFESVQAAALEMKHIVEELENADME